MVDSTGIGQNGRVTVIAWPTQKVLHSLKDGDSVKTLAVGKTTTDTAGNFVLRADPTVSLGQYMEADGTINFEIVGDSGAKGATFSFPRRSDKAAAIGWVAPEWTTKTGAAKSLAVSLQLGRTAEVDEDSVDAPARATEKNAADCKPDVVATYANRPGIVGEVYPGSHATGDLQYSTAATSTLGVGFSVSGSVGSFSASGTSTSSSESTIDFPTASASQRKVWQTTFEYKKYRTWALNSNNLGCHIYGYEVRPSGWDGGATGYNAASSPSATHCAPVSVFPTTLTKDTATAITFSNGLDISSVIGIDLSSRTGFTTKTKIAFRFSSAGQLCGTNASWPSANRVVGK